MQKIQKNPGEDKMLTLPELNYKYDELEPYIDAQTMEIHYSKHHQTYIDKLGDALKDSEWAEKSIEEILQNLDALPEDIRTAVHNNGGGHYNHSLFWSYMTPGGSPLEGKLSNMINASFGSFEDFKMAFSASAVGRFGSGWVWLTQTGEKLEILSSPNQDSPIMDGTAPILGLDVWEHAYYLKYQNRRPEYVENWWNVVDWRTVNSNLGH